MIRTLRRWWLRYRMAGLLLREKELRASAAHALAEADECSRRAACIRLELTCH